MHYCKITAFYNLGKQFKQIQIIFAVGNKMSSAARRACVDADPLDYLTLSDEPAGYFEFPRTNILRIEYKKE